MVHAFKIALNFLVVCSLLVSCTIFQPSLADNCQTTVDAMRGLTNDLHIPKNLNEDGNGERTGNEFDPNEYFAVLDHLEMEAGYTLDYVFAYRGGPILYARHIDQPPYSDINDLDEATGGTYIVGDYDLVVPNYLNYVFVDDTREGYLQFILLLIHGAQFYRRGHASYNDSEVVCNQGGIDDLFSRPPVYGYELPKAIHYQTRVLDVTPQVTLRHRTATVQVVTFTHWGGFYEGIFTISRDFPHQVLDFTVKELIPYNIPVKF